MAISTITSIIPDRNTPVLAKGNASDKMTDTWYYFLLALNSKLESIAPTTYVASIMAASNMVIITPLSGTGDVTIDVDPVAILSDANATAIIEQNVLYAVRRSWFMI